MSNRRLNRHLSGWRRGDALPDSIQRTDRGPTKPRFPDKPKPTPAPARKYGPEDDLAATIRRNREKRLQTTAAAHIARPSKP